MILFICIEHALFPASKSLLACTMSLITSGASCFKLLSLLCLRGGQSPFSYVNFIIEPSRSTFVATVTVTRHNPLHCVMNSVVMQLRGKLCN